MKGRVAPMALENPNLKFIACGNTQANQSKAEGKPVTLISEAKLMPSGVVHLIELEERATEISLSQHHNARRSSNSGPHPAFGLAWGASSIEQAHPGAARTRLPERIADPFECEPAPPSPSRGLRRA